MDFNGTKIDPSPDYSLGQSKTTSQGTYLNYIHTFRPELLLELKAGFTRINSIHATECWNQCESEGWDPEQQYRLG